MDSKSRVIVVGASAGGVDALLQLAGELPGDLAAPVLIVLHIGRHPSQLPELLATRGSLRAVFAETGALPEPGTLYVAPPDCHLLLEHGRLRLTRGPKENHARPAVDPLFRSAALSLGPRAVGVVLTGRLDDGSAGLHAIKACGGTAVVQDPLDAVEPGMPYAALKATDVDHVVGLDGMAALLAGLARPLDAPAHVDPPPWLRTEHAVSLGEMTVEGLQTIAKPSPFTCPDCGGVMFELNAERLPRFRCHTGHAFSLATLAQMQGETMEAQLWAALRSVQEQRAALRRLVELHASLSPDSEQADRTKVALLAGYAARLRKLVESAPKPGPEPLAVESSDE